MERVKGIEPSSQPWEGHILPLNHTRLLVEPQPRGRRLTRHASARQARFCIADILKTAFIYQTPVRVAISALRVKSNKRFQLPDGGAQGDFNLRPALGEVDLPGLDFTNVEIIQRRAALGHDARGGDVQL